MTQLSFTVPGKGFSVNQTYCRNRATKTTEARAWEHNMAMHLDEIKALTDFANTWKASPTGAGIEVRITYRVPAFIFYKKDGLISVKSMDLDNQVKIMLDILFGKRLGINDTHVSKLVLQKEAADKYEIEICLKIR